jgi:hypothetical protein
VLSQTKKSTSSRSNQESKEDQGEIIDIFKINSSGLQKDNSITPSAFKKGLHASADSDINVDQSINVPNPGDTIAAQEEIDSQQNPRSSSKSQSSNKSSKSLKSPQIPPKYGFSIRLSPLYRRIIKKHQVEFFPLYKEFIMDSTCEKKSVENDYEKDNSSKDTSLNKSKVKKSLNNSSLSSSNEDNTSGSFKTTIIQRPPFANEHEFFLSPETYNDIIEIMPLYFKKLKEYLDREDTLESWELRNISAILGKALIPDSIAPTRRNARNLAQKVKNYIQKMTESEISKSTNIKDSKKTKESNLTNNASLTSNSNSTAKSNSTTNTDRTRNNLIIREICTGAGLSTALMWIEIQKIFNQITNSTSSDQTKISDQSKSSESGSSANNADAPKKVLNSSKPSSSTNLIPITIISTDNALESVVMSAILMSVFEIPHVIVGGQIPEELLHFPGVVLQYMDAERALANEKNRGFKYDCIVSDHGISYFPAHVHDEILKDIIQLLEPNSCIQICGLEPNVKVSLDYMHMVKSILFGKGNQRNNYKSLRQQRQQKEEIKNEKVIYDIEQESHRSTIKAFYTDETASLFDMLHSFILTKNLNIPLFVQYIRTIINIVKTTKELGGEIQSPIKRTRDQVRSLLKKEIKQEDVSVKIVPAFEKGSRVARTLRLQRGAC